MYSGQVRISLRPPPLPGGRWAVTRCDVPDGPYLKGTASPLPSRGARPGPNDSQHHSGVAAITS